MELKIKIAGAEILRVQNVEQMNGSFSHIMLGLSGFMTENKTSKKSCRGTER